MFLYVDTDSTELSKLLDMKGVKRSDQTQFVDLYKEQHSKLQSEMTGAGGHGLASVLASGVASLPGSPAHSGGDQSRIAKLEKIIKNRLYYFVLCWFGNLSVILCNLFISFILVIIHLYYFILMQKHEIQTTEL